ncbi:reverse transcriptase-like protein, partial [Myroides marinus]|nr:reverse transcriptase-like protein [Myroides marinus]
PCWSISTYISNIQHFSASFNSILFFWVRRNCNSAAHSIAKFAVSSNMSFIFNSGNLPCALELVCKEDYPVCNSFSV